MTYIIIKQVVAASTSDIGLLRTAQEKSRWKSEDGANINSEYWEWLFLAIEKEQQKSL